TGRFTRSEKADLLNDIDIINAYYSEKKYANMYAISNKYYDALIYKKPILVNSNVHIGKIVSQNKVGFAVDINKSDVTNKIYNDYLKFDFKEFYDRCDEVLQKVLKEDREYCDQVFDFVKRT